MQSGNKSVLLQDLTEGVNGWFLPCSTDTTTMTKPASATSTPIKPERITARTRLRFEEPTPAQVRALRLWVGLSQAENAALLCVNAPTFARWEKEAADADNACQMPAGIWLLMRIQLDRVRAGLPPFE